MQRDIQDNSAWLSRLERPDARNRAVEAKAMRRVAVLWGGGAGFVVAVVTFLIMGQVTGWWHSGPMALAIECDQPPGAPTSCWLRAPILVPAAPSRPLPPLPAAWSPPRLLTDEEVGFKPAPIPLPPPHATAPAQPAEPQP